MHKLNSHIDRTKKQPVRFRCVNPACAVQGEPFEFTSDQDRCPKCTAIGPPYVVVLVLIHILIPDPHGKLVGESQLRYRVACDSSRDATATFTNKEAATGDPSASNCPGCIAEAKRVGYKYQMAGGLVVGNMQPALA